MEPATIKSRVSCGRLRVSSPWQTNTPAVLCRGLMFTAVFCCSQGLWYELDGDDHGDRAGSRGSSIREQTIDRDNGGQDISHLMDGDGRRAVREQRNRLRLQDDVAVEPVCLFHRMGGRGFKDVEVRPVVGSNIRPNDASTQSGYLRRVADLTTECAVGDCCEL